MSFLRGSTNYVWCTTSVLGKGATGAVYQGVNKSNGEPVAVKTFNQVSHMRPQNVQMREFEVLKKVKHENIVKLLAIEEEQEGRGKVIVMELCTGGSLFNILDDPENTFGLEEKEFLLVLEHLTAGMKHLRDNNLVHRDLKPGNIMKFINDDGTTIYKLTDFGAARELEEGQQFFSLYGTEEYLHPDMYERAVLRKPVGKTFAATVDLWSIGVTLYHVATGNLPFRPYGGRRNKEIMFHITTKKASGVISGIQTKEGGPIEWRRDLPVTCQLSVGLKKYVTPLLAGLLEADPQKVWTFEKFFNEVTNLLSRKVIHIFHVNSASVIKVLIHPDENLNHLKGYISEQTDIKSESQVILLKSNLFSELVDEDTRAGGYPSTTEEESLFLFSRENNNVIVPTETELPKFPEFPNLVHVENDAAHAKLSCSIGYVCKRRIEKISLCSILIKESVENFIKFIKNMLNSLSQSCAHITEMTNSKKEILQLLNIVRHVSFSESNNFLNQSKIYSFQNLEEIIKISNSFLSETNPKVKKLYHKNVKENVLHSEWESLSRFIKCPASTRAPARAKTQVGKLRDSWQHLGRDKATRTLSYNDEQFHILEKIKISETGRRIKTLLEDECFPAFSQLADALSDWFKIAQTAFLQTMILKKDVLFYSSKLDNILQKFSYEILQLVDEIKKKTLNDGSPQLVSPLSKIQINQLKLSVNEADSITQEILAIVAENSEFVTLYDKLIEEKLKIIKDF